MNTQTEMNRTAMTQELELNIEELEEVIAPGISRNHNDTAVDELSVEELEEVIAPGLTRNHNETAEVDLCFEELEEVIAPTKTWLPANF